MAEPLRGFGKKIASQNINLIISSSVFLLNDQWDFTDWSFFLGGSMLIKTVTPIWLSLIHTIIGFQLLYPLNPVPETDPFINCLDDP